MRKLIVIIGLLAALTAAEGLNRLSTLVGAFQGTDAPIYQAMLIVSVIAAGTLLVSIFHPVPRWLKAVLVLALFASAGLMCLAPNLPVTQQILGGLAVAFIGAIAISTPKKAAPTIAP